jgi:hypothetical protein
MKSGRVEYAPDYKSHRSIAEIAASHICTTDCDPDKRLLEAAHQHIDGLRAKRVAERARLERELINAALPFANTDMDLSTEKSLRYELHLAAKALAEFESKQKE